MRSTSKSQFFRTLFIIFTIFMHTNASTQFLTSEDIYDMSQINAEPNINNEYQLIHSQANPSNTVFTALVAFTGSANTWVNATNPIVKYLNFTYVFQNNMQFQIQISDANNSRWEVPYQWPFPYANNSELIPIQNGQANIEVLQNPFAFVVTRNQTGEVLFDTRVGNFVYSDYYIEISTTLPSPYFFGMGERGHNLTLGPNGTYTIWNIDFNQNVDNNEEGHNSYGCHPVYLSKEKSGNWHMTFLRNVNAMNVILQNGETLTYKIVGGILDFNFFLGNTMPESVIVNYHQYLGGWTIPAFWAMGYHQSRWGYNNLSVLTQVVANFSYFDLPLDVIWSDIDYMYNYLDFTIDETRFPPVQFEEMLEEYEKRWVPIIDAGIGLDGEETYEEGVDMDVFIKCPNGSYVVGVVWPGETSWVDWWNPNATSFWQYGINTVHKLVPYSGIWLDMNEISNLVNGSYNYEPNLTDIRNALPYTPGHVLYTDTIRVDAVHYNGEADFNTHSLFNIMEQNVTYNYLKTLSPLPFILSRSTVFGSGKFASHWTGDNNSSWLFLQLSIPSIMNFNIFGIPHTGSDICGFKANATEEMCSRWMQLGLLYPFSRNHAENDTIHQEPWALGPTLLETSRIAMDLKYSILKYYYSIFMLKGGYGSIFRPVFFEFPDDETLMNQELPYLNNQFLIGSGLMAAPVVQGENYEVNVYFPADRWFDFFTGQLMHAYNQEGSVWENYPAPLNSTIPLFVRGGNIIPIQNTTGVMRSDDLNNNYTLLIALEQYLSFTWGVKNGYVFSLNNFTETSVYENCVVENNGCMLGMMVNATMALGKGVLNLGFYGAANNNEEIGLTGLKIYGFYNDNSEEMNEEELTYQSVRQQVMINGKMVLNQLLPIQQYNVLYVNFTNAESIGGGDMITVIEYFQPGPIDFTISEQEFV